MAHLLMISKLQPALGSVGPHATHLWSLKKMAIGQLGALKIPWLYWILLACSPMQMATLKGYMYYYI